MIIKNGIITGCLIFFSLLSLQAETIRGSFVDKIQIEGVSDFRKQIEISPSEILLFSPGVNARFLKGFQLEIVLSHALKQYADSFAVELYSAVVTQDGSEEYEGRRILFEVLPFLNNIYVQIPIGKQKVNTESLPPGTYSPSKAIEAGQFPLLFTIQPVMKGVPDSILSKSFYINIQPDVEKKGLFDLSLTKPPGFEDAEYEVFIDDELFENGGKEHVFDAGIHSLKVLSEVFKEETTSFTIEPGKTTKVDIILERSISVLIIDIIKEAVIFIDGEKVDTLPGEEKPLTTGLHSILIKVGTQTITKKIDIKSGKRYNISLIFDIEIKEN
ncbi:MAG: hypothetical protein JXJ04_11665 [Spirochaetales bacterium]|nr:hypothetical protein [Spirochaetales bacterium]